MNGFFYPAKYLWVLWSLKANNNPPAFQEKLTQSTITKEYKRFTNLLKKLSIKQKPFHLHITTPAARRSMKVFLCSLNNREEVKRFFDVRLMIIFFHSIQREKRTGFVWSLAEHFESMENQEMKEKDTSKMDM